MNIKELTGILVSIAAAVERTTEIIKPIYIKVKSILLKMEFTECTNLEKKIISIIISIIFCIFLKVYIDIPGVNEPVIVQPILAGLVSSLGSNVLHTLLTILTGIKDGTEARAFRK